MADIREYRDADVPILKRLAGGLHEAVRSFDPYLAPTASIIDAYFAHLVERVRETEGTFLVAAEDSEIIGYLCLFGRVAPPEPDQHPEPYAVVSDLYVLPAHRGRDIGKALMQAAEARARSLGARKIELNVLAGNRAAADFYRRLGYRERIRTYTKPLEPQP